MAGRRGTETRALSGQVLVRLPAATATRAAALAAAEGLTASAWARRHLVAAAGTDPAEAVPVSPRHPRRPPPPELILYIASLREHVAELSCSMTQATIKTRTDGADVRHAEIEALIPRVKAAVHSLDHLKNRLLEQAAGSTQ